MPMPYENPKSFSEQMKNFSQTLATEMKAIYNAVKLRLTKDDADALYLEKTGKAASAKSADSVDWNNIQNKPEFGSLASKNEVDISSVTGLEERLSKSDEDYGSISEGSVNESV